MKVCAYCHMLRPLEAFDRREASPDGLSRKCKPCAKAYRERNAARYRELRKAHYARNRAAEKQKALEYYQANRDDCIARHAEYKRAHAEAMREYRRRTAAHYVARTARYRAALSQRTPKWLTVEELKQIAAFYELAALFERITGVPHHVDHVIPLRGKTVSGLHVASNLAVIPAKQNIGKGNKYHVDPPAAAPASIRASAPAPAAEGCL